MAKSKNNLPNNPGGKRIYICRPWITVKGRRIYARNYGKKAFCFWVDEERSKDA